MAGTAPGDFQVVTEGTVARVLVGCEVDLANIDTFSGHVGAALAHPGGTAVVVDLARCPYLDSVGLHVLYEGTARATATGMRFTLAGAEGIVRRLLDVIDVDGVLDVAG